jgi:hypothetical protein
MKLRELCEKVLQVSALREASYIPGTYQYAQSFSECTEKIVGGDCPEWTLIYFLAISGDGVDYARDYLNATNKETSQC